MDAVSLDYPLGYGKAYANRVLNLGNYVFHIEEFYTRLYKAPRPCYKQAHTEPSAEDVVPSATPG